MGDIMVDVVVDVRMEFVEKD